MRPILAAILLGISMAALGSPGGGGGGGGGGHGGGGSGGAPASGAMHGGGTSAGSHLSGGPHLSADTHPSSDAHAPHPGIAASLRGWWHHRHDHNGYSHNPTDRLVLCTDERRRLVNCERERALPER